MKKKKPQRILDELCKTLPVYKHKNHLFLAKRQPCKIKTIHIKYELNILSAIYVAILNIIQNAQLNKTNLLFTYFNFIGHEQHLMTVVINILFIRNTKT